MTERSAEQLQRDIEQSRDAMAAAVDQLVTRANPKRLADDVKQTLLQKAQTPKGKAVIAGVSAIVLLLVVRRLRHHG